MYLVISFLLSLPLLYAQPQHAQPQLPFRFAVMGDMGSGSKAQRLVADQMWDWMQQHPFQIVLMLGDNIYGRTELFGGGSPRLFHKKFDLEYQRFEGAGVVFHAVVGNHDMQTRHAQAEINDRKRFGMLGADGYYQFSSPRQFDVKGRPLIDFFALNSEIKGEKMKAQIAWLTQALPKSHAFWKIVFDHRPLFTVSGQHGPDKSLRAAIEPLLREDHVQFILSGHNHFYARMKPVDGTMQLISGGGGRHLGHPHMDSCAEVADSIFHFVGIEVFPDKVHFTAIDENGKVIDDKVVDSSYLKQETKGCPAR